MNEQNQFHYSRIVIAAYRLPFKIVSKKDKVSLVQNSGGLVSAMLALSQKMKNNPDNNLKHKIVWAGIKEVSSEKLSDKNLENSEFDLCPVSIPENINNKYYGGFCNNLIWPLFHYFPSLSVNDNSYFDAYQKANELFCDELIKIIKPNDFIWIHDYQLFLLPYMIRKKIPEAVIGFFLHIPFPSFEIFRIMPRKWRKEIINGVLGSDLIGFHTNDYTQHFLKSVKCTTGFECRHNIIYAQDRIVKADAFPIGIDFDKFHDACDLPVINLQKLKIQKHIADKKMVFSIDRLDYSKGLLERLNGIELFLELHTEWHERVIFNLVVVPSRDTISRYKEMKIEIEATVGRINGKYSNLAWRPVIYQYKSLKFNELVALYNMSDVGLITPLRDGMNLVAKEYIACQKDNNGMLILSEMAGASSELNEALIINPTDKNEMADAIFNALEMGDDEKKYRIQKMQNRLKKYNIFTWANDFFNQANTIVKEQYIMKVKYINSLILQNIQEKYKDANNRVLFLDYDGTLVPFTNNPENATIDIPTFDLIKLLCDDEKNTVVIISGREKEFLETIFGNLKITLVAEHGYFIKIPGQKWMNELELDFMWKVSVLPILIGYEDRCNGSFVEIKHASLAWHYRDVETEFANVRLAELKDELIGIIGNKENLIITEGHKVLEIKNKGYDKGQTVKKILNTLEPDFIIAMGDDNTDEDIFKVLPVSAVSIKVGSEPSFSKYNLRSQKDVWSFLKSINYIK